MAVSFIGQGTVVRDNTVQTSVSASSPAGAIGDLLVCFIMHDDQSDGTITNSDGALTWTNAVPDSIGSAIRSDDILTQALWAVEDQEDARSFTFGWSTGEQSRLGIFRYRGQHSTPIQTGTKCKGYLPLQDVSVTILGSMAIYFCASDSSSIYYATSLTGGNPAPRGYTNRFASWSSPAAFLISDRLFDGDDYPYPHAQDLGMEAPSVNFNGGNAWNSLWFAIAPLTQDSNTISGITKDKDGSALGSCETYLMKENAAGDEMMFVAKTTSHVSTGAYSFTVVNDTDALFFVYSFKDDSPHVFDVTDHVLVPT